LTGRGNQISVAGDTPATDSNYLCVLSASAVKRKKLIKHNLPKLLIFMKARSRQFP
jgi:hypothetical protein